MAEKSFYKNDQTDYMKVSREIFVAELRGSLFTLNTKKRTSMLCEIALIAKS